MRISLLDFGRIMELPREHGPLMKAVNESLAEFPAFYQDRFLVAVAGDGTIIARAAAPEVRDRLTSLGIAPGFRWEADWLSDGEPSAPAQIAGELWVLGVRRTDGVALCAGQRVESGQPLAMWDLTADLLLRFVELTTGTYRQEFARQEFEAERGKLEAFHRLTSELSELRTPGEILATVAERVTELMGAGTTIIYAHNAARTRLVPLVGHQIPAAELKAVRYEIDLAENLVAEAYSTGVIKLGDVTGGDRTVPALGDLGLKSVLVVPIRLQDRPFGVMVVGRYLHGPFDESQASVLAFTAHQIALTLEQSQLQEQLTQRLQEIDQELNLAKGAQALMLPTEPLRAGRASVAGLSWSAKHLGGDYFDYFADGPYLTVVVADIMGKGVTSALLMSILRSHVRTCFHEEPRLTPELVNRLSRKVFQDFKPQRSFATVLLLNLQVETGELTVFTAGHYLPLLARAGELVDQIHVKSPALGLFDRPVNPAALHTLQLQPGDALLGYTDGVIDTVGEEGARYGTERLRAAFIEGCRRYPAPEAVLAAVRADMERFTVSQPDDTTLCLLKFA